MYTEGNRKKENDYKRKKITSDCEQELQTINEELFKNIHSAYCEWQNNTVCLNQSAYKDLSKSECDTQNSKSCQPGRKKGKSKPKTHTINNDETQNLVDSTIESHSCFNRDLYEAKVKAAKTLQAFKTSLSLRNCQRELKYLDLIEKEQMKLERQKKTKREENNYCTFQHKRSTQIAENNWNIENSKSSELIFDQNASGSEILTSESQDKQNPLTTDTMYMELNTFHHGGDGVCIVLLGKTGTGKSATGNSILLRQAFQEDAETALTKAHISVAYTKIQDKEVCVIDFPGTNDTSNFGHNFIYSFRKTIEGALLNYNQMYIALLFVLKYGDRFTNEDCKILQTVKEFFGSSSLYDCGICLFTHGDLFKKRSKVPFLNWCDKQATELKDLGGLFNECCNRRALFNNQIDDLNNSYREQQRNDLLDIIIRLKNYKVAEFLQRINSSENRAVKSMLPVHEEEIENFVKNVKSKVGDPSSEILPTLKTATDKKIMEVKQWGYDQITTDTLIKPFNEAKIFIDVADWTNDFSQNKTRLKSIPEIRNIDPINRYLTNYTNSQTSTQLALSRKSGKLRSDAKQFP